MTFMAVGIVLSVSVNKKNGEKTDNSNPLNVLSEEI